MDNEFNMNISGEMDNGFGVSYFMNMGEQAGGMDSAKLSVDMGDMGTLAFDQTQAFPYHPYQHLV